jgi:hypothetical protein
MPDHNHFLLQATGLLEQQPELCARMAKQFESAALDFAGRALVLDLLANTGTPQAQEALVKALSSRTALEDPQYPLFLNRLGLVKEPTLDTVRFAERTHESAQGRLRVTTGYMLLAVSPKGEFQSVAQLVDFAKKNPGKLSNASSSNG